MPRTWWRRGLLLYAALTLGVLIRGLLGYALPPTITMGLTMIAFLLAFTHAGLQLGWGIATRFWAVTFVVSLALESLGVLTGWVYGPYHYTSRLGPRAFGLVPWAIPIAWFMMTYPSFVLARRVTPYRFRPQTRFWLVAVLTALIMTTWDLVMDPLMVAGGHWVWEIEGAYFGVPVQNYFGWWLTVFVATVFFQGSARRALEDPPEPAFDRLAVGLYLTTFGGNWIAAWLRGLHGPALAALFALLPWLLWACWTPEAPDGRV